MKNLTYLTNLFILFTIFAHAQTSTLFVGTYTSGASEGVYTFDFDARTGQLFNKKLLAKEANPSYLAITKNKQFLYILNEVDTFDASTGSVSTYKNTEKGYQKINTITTHGAHPCHISLNATEDKIVISNYSGGNVSLHEISEGLIQPAFQVIDHNLVDTKSHAHMAQFFNSQLFVADLGRNFIAEYTENPAINYYASHMYKMMNNAGPRHFRMTQDGEFMYVINELNSTISVLKKSNKGFTRIQNYATTASSYKGENSCADIHISPNENFVYGSNRGENTIVVFKRDQTTGRLSKVQSISVQGNWPRSFVIDPSGSFLLVANERSNSISTFSIDKNTGELTFLNRKEMPAPVCLLF